MRLLEIQEFVFEFWVTVATKILPKLGKYEHIIHSSFNTKKVYHIKVFALVSRQFFEQIID
jgi:hypothetical protein